MKSTRLSLLAVLSGLAVVVAGCNPPAPETEAAGSPDSTAGAELALESVDQRASYGIGYNIGMNIANQSDFAVDMEAVKAGLDDAMAGSDPRIGGESIQAAFSELQDRAATTAAAEAETNLAKANTFLETNKQRPGVTTTDSGLQYEVLQSGTGSKPTADNQVEVHYHGTLIDGTVFDSSVERGEPIVFSVTGVIDGWVEALQLMSVGDKWKLFVPPGLAYGASGQGSIPPNSALIFEVELLSIK